MRSPGLPALPVTHTLLRRLGRLDPFRNAGVS